MTEHEKYIVESKDKLGKTWEEIRTDYNLKFNENKSKNAVRCKYQRVKEKAEKTNKDFDNIYQNKGSVQYNGKDNTTTYDKIIALAHGTQITPENVMKAHGLDETLWQVVSYKSNYWQSQKQGGDILDLYQSKLTVKPYADNEISQSELKEWFRSFEGSYKPSAPSVINKTGNECLSVFISDLHFGKVSTKEATGEDYNMEIASQLFLATIDDIVYRSKSRPIERIFFPIGSDFFHSDTVGRTTTKGTPVHTEVSYKELFKSGLELIIEGIERLSAIGASVDVFQIEGNHDEMSSFYANCVLASHFANRKDVIVDETITRRKYRRYGVTTIGYGHGDKEGKRIPQAMRVEADELIKNSKFYEFHRGHLHGENTIIQDGIIIRTMPVISATDQWHSDMAFVGNTRKVQSFVYHKQKGLTDIWNAHSEF